MNPNQVPPIRHNPMLQILCAWTLVFWLLMAITPISRQDWMMENILVIVSVLLLLFSYRWFQFSNISYLLITVFLSLHLVGAHYTYAETPFGFWMQHWFGFHRNDYDRLIHFSFGLLLAYPMRELLIRVGGLKSGWSYLITVMMILSLGAMFEIFEMWAALLVNPDLGTAYLGTQGDVWDAQQDMFQAALGAISAMLLLGIFNKTRGPHRY